MSHSNNKATSLVVSCAQPHIVWETPRSNLCTIQSCIEDAVAQGSQLLLLPEVMTTGFTTHVQRMAEVAPYPSVVRLQEWAVQYGIAIATTLFVWDRNRIYNRAFFFRPDGTHQTQDKRHPFSMAGESVHVAPAQEVQLWDYLGWRIRAAVCYDLRFPVWLRNKPPLYDLLLVLGNWPTARIDAWDTLLKARAIENLCFVAAANRTGVDPFGIAYSGHSQVISYKGKLLTPAAHTDTELISTRLDAQELAAFRDKFSAWQDADTFELNSKQ